MDNSKLLFKDKPLIVLPTLAKRVGLNKAIFLQQIHFLSRSVNTGELKASEEELRIKNFPFWSTRNIQRIKRDLIEVGLLFCKKQNYSSSDQTLSYSINYSHPILVNLRNKVSDEQADEFIEEECPF